MNLPEYLVLFSNEGVINIEVKFEDDAGKISNKKMNPKEISALVLQNGKGFHKQMAFDEWEFTITKYEIDPNQNKLLIFARQNRPVSNPYPDPSPEDQASFALHLYFDKGEDKLKLAIRRAYLDLSRTIHGIQNYPDARKIADDFLCHAIRELAEKVGADQLSFDVWHQKTTKGLCAVYSEAGYSELYIGQAQKWINMAMKYVYVFGEPHLPGYSGFFKYCHIPIDNIILEKDEFKEMRLFKCAWSRISSYDVYMEFQKSVRVKFSDSSPLAVEFWTWQAQT